MYGFAVLASTIAGGKTAEVYEEFLTAGENWKILSDFSYSGYHYSERAFPQPSGVRVNLAAFGAIPNDGRSDRDALQAAFDELARLGGGVIEFEDGEYLLDSESGETEPLTLRSSNLYLIGKGSGLDGTVLRMKRNLSPLDPDKMYSTPFILNVAPEPRVERRLAKLAQGGPRGSCELELDDVGQLKVGDWVTLFLEDSSAKVEFFQGRNVSELWSRVSDVGIMVTERHRIVDVSGNRVRFAEPLQVSVNSEYAWEIREYHALEEVGIEGIRFVGGWEEDFVHHRSARDDGAWSCLKMDSVRNTWIRDVAFENWNYGLRMDNCSAVSVLRVSIEGTSGHFGVHTRTGYGVLVGLVKDTANHHHGPSVGYQSASSVYWRYEGSDGSSFDSHSTGPYATLLDASSGGWTYGRTGGPLVGMPNHMGYLTIWNFERTAGKEPVFDFWRNHPNQRDRFLNPVIVGFHGKKTRFEKSSLGAFESLGKPVQPKSLFEAQLANRLGELPEFLVAEIELWENRQN